MTSSEFDLEFDASTERHTGRISLSLGDYANFSIDSVEIAQHGRRWYARAFIEPYNMTADWHSICVSDKLAPIARPASIFLADERSVKCVIVEFEAFANYNFQGQSSLRLVLEAGTVST